MDSEIKKKKNIQVTLKLSINPRDVENKLSTVQYQGYNKYQHKVCKRLSNKQNSKTSFALFSVKCIVIYLLTYSFQQISICLIIGVKKALHY